MQIHTGISIGTLSHSVSSIPNCCQKVDQLSGEMHIFRILFYPPLTALHHHSSPLLPNKFLAKLHPRVLGVIYRMFIHWTLESGD